MPATVLGNGIYTGAEVAKILGVSQPRVTAWFGGWARRKPPVFASDYRGMFYQLTISFLDFVDTAVAVTLITKHKTSIQTVRKLRKKLSEKWDTPHPFSRAELLTDAAGRQIFCERMMEGGKAGLMDVLKDQFAMPEVLLPFLKKVEYNAQTSLAQVFPLTERVILDPRRKYGKPIVRGTGMPTSILYQCFEATGSADIVANWYSVTPEDVEAAVSFETNFSGIAA